MNSVTLDWEILDQDSNQAFDIAARFVHGGREIIRKDFPDIEELFPLCKVHHFGVHFDKTWIAISIRFIAQPSVMIAGGLMKPTEVAYFSAFLQRKILPIEPAVLKNELSSDWYGENAFAYVGPFEQNKASRSDMEKHLDYWFDSTLIPKAADMNNRRIARAIPIPPSYDMSLISKSVWVLEGEDEAKQGSAFALKGVGLVTCHHVLSKDTVAFRHDEPSQKFPVKIVASNDAIDLAILSINASFHGELESGTADNLKQMDHLAVVGFPNYRLGDGPFIAMGLVTSFRMKLGIRRIVTDAPIVAGNSGGAVIGEGNKVIGIAVTGARYLQDTKHTEDLGIIPIEALNHLNK